VLTLKAEPGRTGWWSSEDDRGKYLGDSFLYSGFTDGRSFLAIATIDLRKVPHGAPLRLALLQLTGLSAARLRPEAGGQWQVQLLAADAVPDLTGASFQTLSGIPAAITLLPALSAADLDAGQSNVWQFGQAEREWLAAQLDAGAASVVARVSGPTAGKNTLFAWDSGSGPATKGEGPRLVLSLGPAPYATAAPTTRQTGTAVGTATQIATPRH
jgi:hypothetical protein